MGEKTVLESSTEPSIVTPKYNPALHNKSVYQQGMGTCSETQNRELVMLPLAYRTITLQYLHNTSTKSKNKTALINAQTLFLTHSY